MTEDLIEERSEERITLGRRLALITGHFWDTLVEVWYIVLLIPELGWDWILTCLPLRKLRSTPKKKELEDAT